MRRLAGVRIARDPALRARLVEAGIARARRSTVDVFAETVAEEVMRAL